MGCGSSSLKGDDVPNLNSQPVTAPENQPMKKVKTNFSNIDYDADVQHRRLTEYAPHETPAPIRELSHDASAEQAGGPADAQHRPSKNKDLDPNQGSLNADPSTEASYPHQTGAGTEKDAALKPYKTIDSGDWDKDDVNNAASQQTRATPGDPTSSTAKDAFASANDPANGTNGTEDTFHDAHDEHQDSEHKKSWLGQKYASFASAKRGTGPSDEDVLKYTGKDRQELGEWAQGRDGVGGNQSAATAQVAGEGTL
jgi:hypothetical protein